VAVRLPLSGPENSVRALWNRVAIEWCRMFHPEPYWPVHGHYRCRVCLRHYAVPWQEDDAFARRELARTDSSDGRRGSLDLPATGIGDEIIRHVPRVSEDDEQSRMVYHL
jgi:hypothetical protein